VVVFVLGYISIGITSARTVVAQPPIAAKWFGRVFRSCVQLCGGSCVVRVTCVLF